jgi:cell division septum initiation protein DivIVA
MTAATATTIDPAAVLARVVELEERVAVLTERAKSAIADAAREKLAADAAERESLRLTERVESLEARVMVLARANGELRAAADRRAAMGECLAIVPDGFYPFVTAPTVTWNMIKAQAAARQRMGYIVPPPDFYDTPADSGPLTAPF